MINKLLEITEASSEQWFGKFIPKSKIRFFYTSGNTELHGKLTLFLFEEDKNPIAVVKISRDYRHSYSVKYEYDNLQKLNELKNKISGIPEPYYYGEHNKNYFLIESFLPGISLYNEFNNLFLTEKHKEEAGKVLESVFSWIRDFHSLTAKRISVGDFFKDHKIVDIDTNAIIAVGTIQGDFWLKNLLLNSSGLSVLDWEWSEPKLPLMWDILFFSFTVLRHLTHYYPLKGDPAELISLFNNDYQWLVKLLKQNIDNYLLHFNIEDKIEPHIIYFLTYLAERDSKRYGLKSTEDKYWGNVLSLFRRKL